MRDRPVRSMHAEMRALAAATGKGTPPHERGRRGESGLPYLCDVSGDGEAPGVTIVQWRCPGCAIAGHAAARRDPHERVVRTTDGTWVTARESANNAIRKFGYPLPLIP